MQRYSIFAQGAEGMSRRALYEQLYSLYSRVERTSPNDLARQIDRLFPMMRDTQLAFCRGECIGAMIVLNRGGIYRVATLHVSQHMRNHGVTAVLFDALRKKMPPEVKTLQAATIARDNERSQMNVKGAGATLVRTYRVYKCNV